MILSAGRRNLKSKRGGVAAVEFAVCLPAIVLLVMASIESCSMIFLDQTLYVSGYEGVRAAIQQDATNADVLQRCNDILDARYVNGSSIEIEPADVADVASGQTITITVTAPCDSNAIMPSWFFGGKTLQTSSTMVKE